MRIAAISDVHGNLRALQAVLADIAQQGVDAVVNLGDLLSGQRIILQRIFERVRRLELHAEIPPSHYEPGATPQSRPPTTGANASGESHTEEREKVQL